MNAIVYMATVDCVSTVDIALKLIPAVDGEEPIEPVDGMQRIRVNVPGAANGDDVGELLRAFGAVIAIKGAVRITIEPIGDAKDAR